MSKKILQALGAFGAPLLTLACTVLAARFIDEDEPVKALGAALAGLVGFALTQVQMSRAEARPTVSGTS